RMWSSAVTPSDIMRDGRTRSTVRVRSRAEPHACVLKWSLTSLSPLNRKIAVCLHCSRTCRCLRP
ncbi:hypothetical protein LTS06_012773, partial [Exophiala xenobiotica]